MTCSRCHQPGDRPGQRYCRDCHNTYMRRWRADRGGHTALTPQERYKDTARSILAVNIRRGKVHRETTCEQCAATGIPIEGHHHRGYDHPLEVTWLCRRCHREQHATRRPAVTLPEG